MITRLYNTIIAYLFAPMPTHKKKTLSDLPRSRKRWTDDEISDLLRMHTCYDIPIIQIADELDRPEAGIRSKLISLGYSTKGGK